MTKRQPIFRWNTNLEESEKEETERYSGPPYSQRMIKWVQKYYLPNKEQE